MCGCGVAVANALDALKAGAAHVTRGEAGAGVREIIDSLIADDLQRDVPQ
jgi:3-deoxy-D-manno-octulosonate 8-phosphate phosphatase KdsC-like HAD superfamily phosphatase